jgi:hypothetical protein
MNKFCPKLVASAVINTTVDVDAMCVKEKCGYYDEHAQQCSQVSQAMALRDIAEQLKRNADAMLDYSPAKEPVDVELQPVVIPGRLCKECKSYLLCMDDYPCCDCVVNGKTTYRKWISRNDIL